MTRRLRINGLLALRRRLEILSTQAGGQAEAKEQAAAALLQVERICAQHRFAAEELPAPSRNALAALRALAAGQASPAARGAPTPDPVLQACFERVNQACFGGRVARPLLRWSRRETYREFGSCQLQPPMVTISRSLVRPGVPRQVLDFVMFHELLHLEIPAGGNGRRRALHSPAFRQAERAHPDYPAASAYLRDLSTRLRGELGRKPSRRARRPMRSRTRK